jgi:hypothetical protein
MWGTAVGELHLQDLARAALIQDDLAPAKEAERIGVEGKLPYNAVHNLSVDAAFEVARRVMLRLVFR